ncbi:MAG: hypothetical protein O7F76_01880 [Planctomycetota bacterium]|nr:hypothetical protein [Planctomycetota bacterium]
MFSNPHGWAQIRLLGGWQRVFAFVGVYGLAVLVFHVVIYRVSRDEFTPAQFASGALIVMTYIQAAIIFLVGATAIKKSIHRDFTSEMIASHRMTRMSGYTATIGYMTGATARVWLMVLVNWLVCAVLARVAGFSILVPTTILVVFACLGLMCWTFAVLVGLGTRGTTSIGGLLVVILVLWNTGAIIGVPGLALLVGHTAIIDLQDSLVDGIQESSIVISMIGQLTFALAFFIAAARKFRRDDVSAFTPSLACALLAAFALLSAVALEHYPNTGGRFLRTVITSTHQTIATLVALAILAYLPVTTIARSAALWTRRRSKDSEFRGPGPGPFWLGPITATLIVLAILNAVAWAGDGALTGLVLGEGSRAGVLIAIPFFLCVMTGGAIARYVYSRASSVIWFLVGYAVLFWAIPPLLDLSMAAAAGRDFDDPFSWVFGCSPVGTWIIAIDFATTAPVVPGLIFQAAVACLSLIPAFRARLTSAPAASD